MQIKNAPTFVVKSIRNLVTAFTGLDPVRSYFVMARTIGLHLILFFLLVQTIGRITPVVAASGTETLWGVTQTCDFTMIDPTFSIDGVTQGLDAKTASCAWEASARDTAWTITEFSRTSFDLIHDVQLEIAFSVDYWLAGNKLLLEVSKDGGTNWETLEVFDRQNPPPEQNTTKTYALNQVFHTPADLQVMQLRLMVPGGEHPPATFVILLDGASVTVIGENFPTPAPSLTETLLLEQTATSLPTGTLEPAPSVTATITGTVAFITPVVTEITPTVTITVTATPTLTLTPSSVTPSPTVTPYTALTLKTGQDIQSQELWGVEQTCGAAIPNPANSLDQAFNDQAASCSGEFTFTSFQHTSFTHIVDIIIEVRFSVQDWVDDSFTLEIFDGSQWHVLDQFGVSKSIPPGSLLTLGYRINNYLSSPEQVNQAALRWVGDSANQNPDNWSMVIDEARLSVAGGTPGQVTFAPLPMASFDALAFINALTAGSPHGDQSMLTDGCSACHRGHAGSGVELRGIWPEEAVCFSCHGSSGPGINVQPVFVNYVNTVTSFFTHDVMRTNAVHRLGQSSGGDFGGGNRHVECEDCHDPHNAAGGSSAAPNLPPPMAGASGVDPVWSGAGSPSSYNWLDSAAGEYQVCFKCHSSFTSLPTYPPDGLRKLTNTSAGQIPDSRDLAQEFNPAQTSFHPVAAQGRNQNIPAGSFVNGWTQTSLVYCTDCHSNPAAAAGASGAHGSPLLHLLNGATNYSTVVVNGSARVSSGQVCFQCHNYQTYVTGQNSSTNFEYHAKHMNNDWGTTCYTCHDSHGSEQQHLINLDASAMTFTNGRNSQTAWYYDPVSNKAGCFLSCHTVTHNPKEYTP